MKQQILAGAVSLALAATMTNGAMAFDQGLGECQAQPHPFVAAVDLRFDLAEGFERRGNVLGPHTDTGVDDAERDR